MGLILETVQRLTRAVEANAARLGREGVVLSAGQILDRGDSVRLAGANQISPNGSCKLLRAADAWIALNLARPEDREAMPAWLCDAGATDEWGDIARRVRQRPAKYLLNQARLLSLPMSIVGELSQADSGPRLLPVGAGGRISAHLRVLDLSSLWAGPLCASIFAELGAEVERVEADSRPEHRDTPHYRRLNGRKSVSVHDISSQAGVAWLRAKLRDVDVLVTSSRMRAFLQRGIDPFNSDTLRSHAVWVAISGYGWTSGAEDRVGFGDDAAAAAGLVSWLDDEPSFVGDALADPITGLAAAALALDALARGGGFLVDAGLAQCTASARNISRRLM